ncbi:MAG: PIG-L family deacetylase [Lacisediminihabitans sp.]
MLFVHAHPDDETISTGGTIATLIDRGAIVTVLSCTRGERGEVIPAELKPLEGNSAQLAEHRVAELASAMAVLGVTDQRFLGNPGARRADLPPRRYLDSGMRWGEAGPEPLLELDPESLCAASFGEVAADIATVIVDIDADAVVSYDARGGYGHPDHIRAHEAALRAAEVMRVPFYAIVPDDSGEAELRGADVVSVDVSAALGRKTNALRAHRSQVTVDGGRFSLSSGPSRPIAAQEAFRRVVAERPGLIAWKDQGFVAQLMACLLAFVIGTLIGGLGTVNHQVQLTVGGADLWLGVVVSLAIVAALLVGLRLVFESRAAPGFAAMGVLGAIGLLSLAGPGGSVLVPANPAGYAWTFGPAIISLAVLAWPRIARPAASRSAAGQTAGLPSRGPDGQDTIESSLEPKGTSSP